MFLLISAAAVSGDETDEILKLAEQDDAQAQCLIGQKYLTGDGVDKSTTEAVKWLTKAGEQGIIEAQMSLGALFIDGRTVPKNSFESAKWYQFAALQGEPVAQRQLARMHLAGAGVVKDDLEAYKWASLAADQGDPAADRIIDFLKKRMLPQQIAEAKTRASDFKELKSLDAGGEVIEGVDSIPKVAPPLE